ncbi:hypothetical protein LP416_01675 [Polaromonas sp. P2-4]|nr:hypothetical protein LP416_01675 [Polaromonas sp. P2-4]
MVFTSFFNQPGRQQALTEGPAAPLTAFAHSRNRLASGPTYRASPVLHNARLA